MHLLQKEKLSKNDFLFCCGTNQRIPVLRLGPVSHHESRQQNSRYFLHDEDVGGDEEYCYDVDPPPLLVKTLIVLWPRISRVNLRFLWKICSMEIEQYTAAIMNHHQHVHFIEELVAISTVLLLFLMALLAFACSLHQTQATDGFRQAVRRSFIISLEIFTCSCSFQYLFDSFYPIPNCFSSMKDTLFLLLLLLLSTAQASRAASLWQPSRVVGRGGTRRSCNNSERWEWASDFGRVVLYWPTPSGRKDDWETTKKERCSLPTRTRRRTIGRNVALRFFFKIYSLWRYAVTMECRKQSK